jgi:hypothetical protein
MDHEEIYLLMMDALDGELAQEGWETLEAHLHTCPPCAQEWYALQAVETLLRTTPALVPPINLVERTLGRLPRPAYRTWLVGATYSLLLLSGVLPLVGLVVLLVTVGGAFFDLSIMQTVLATMWETVSLLPVMLTALLNVLGAFIAQQPMVVGVLLMMVGLIMVWGGVYSQLITPTPRLAMNTVRA